MTTEQISSADEDYNDIIERSRATTKWTMK